MQTEPEITFDGIPRSEWVEDYVRDRIARLERRHADLIACRVVIEQAQHGARTGNPYRVRVEATVPPKKDLVADKQGEVEDPQVALRPIVKDAFEALEKQLERETEKRRGDVKQHAREEREEGRRGYVVDLDPVANHGFVENDRGETYYFNRNAVLGDAFDRLVRGTEVRFEGEETEGGLRASSVRILSEPEGTLAEPRDG